MKLSEKYVRKGEVPDKKVGKIEISDDNYAILEAFEQLLAAINTRGTI